MSARDLEISIKQAMLRRDYEAAMKLWDALLDLAQRKSDFDFCEQLRDEIEAEQKRASRKKFLGLVAF